MLCLFKGSVLRRDRFPFSRNGYYKDKNLFADRMIPISKSANLEVSKYVTNLQPLPMGADMTSGEELTPATFEAKSFGPKLQSCNIGLIQFLRRSLLTLNLP